MASRDLINSLTLVPSIPPILATASTTAAAVAIDTAEYESLMVVFDVGVIDTACTVALSLVECATLSGSYTAVAVGDLIVPLGTSASNQANPATLVLANSNGNPVAIGYRGALRYVKPQITLAGTVGTGAAVGAIGVLGNGRHQGGAMLTSSIIQ